MNNEEMVITSAEKIRSHELINSVLFKWLRFQYEKKQRARVITMPASSGRQERMIIQYLAELNYEFERGHFIHLQTFDNRFEASETGIVSNEWSHPCCWTHHKCVDIFRKLIKLRKEEQDLCPVAAWFDLCGGLTDDNYYGMQSVIDKVFTDGSLLFTTLAIDVVRGLSKESVAGKMYSQFSRGVLRRKIATDILLNNMAESVGKYLSPVFEPYTYRRNNAPTSYAVFGYLVGEK